MRAPRVLKASLFLAGVLLALLLVLPVRAPLSDEELARRVRASQPAWGNYDEDLKAQLGAAPVAEWEGRLTRLQWASGVLQISFSLTGPWAKRDVAIPILVQLPDGETFRDEAAIREGSQITYRLSTSLEHPPQWVVVRYPFYGERRIVLSEDGRWESAEN